MEENGYDVWSVKWIPYSNSLDTYEIPDILLEEVQSGEIDPTSCGKYELERMALEKYYEKNVLSLSQLQDPIDELSEMFLEDKYISGKHSVFQ